MIPRNTDVRKSRGTSAISEARSTKPNPLGRLAEKAKTEPDKLNFDFKPLLRFGTGSNHRQNDLCRKPTQKLKQQPYPLFTFSDFDDVLHQVVEFFPAFELPG